MPSLLVSDPVCSEDSLRHLPEKKETLSSCAHQVVFQKNPCDLRIISLVDLHESHFTFWSFLQSPLWAMGTRRLAVANAHTAGLPSGEE